MADDAPPQRLIEVDSTYVTNRGHTVQVAHRGGSYCFVTFPPRTQWNKAFKRQAWPIERFYLSKNHWFPDVLQDDVPQA